MSLLVHLSCSLGASSTWRVSCSLVTFRASSSSASRRQKKDKVSARNKQSSRGQLDDNGVAGFGTKKVEKWTCVQSCGACCKLDKGPEFGTPEEIFDDPADVQLFKSMVGSDGWCVHYEKSTRRCSIYEDRPYFCRVEEQVFQNLYGIDKKRFNKEACGSCRDTIKVIYGANSTEMENFNLAVKSSPIS